MSSRHNPFRYEEHIVAIIDILGFSSLVEASNSNPAAFETVKNLLRVDELFSKFLEFFPSAQGGFFSDTFVLSMRFPSTQTFYVIREIGHLCQYLLMQGLPCRGAICAGPLYHNGSYVVGPALVRAHEMEKSKAIYPRVILDEHVLEHWSQDVKEGSSIELLAPLVKQDSDGQHFIDILSGLYPANFYQWANFVEGFDPLPTHSVFIARARQFVSRCLEEHANNSRVLQKYEWLAAQLESYPYPGR